MGYYILGERVAFGLKEMLTIQFIKGLMQRWALMETKRSPKMSKNIKTPGNNHSCIPVFLDYVSLTLELGRGGGNKVF